MTRVILLFFNVFLLIGCAATSTDHETVFYPPLPETPKIQFLTSISSERDLGNVNEFNEFLLGRQEGSRDLARPFAIAHRRGEIYVVDKSFKKVIIIDLENKSFGQIVDVKRGGLQEPMSIFITDNGDKYIADAGRGQVVVYSADNEYIRSYGVEKQFRPTSAVVGGDRLYVCDITEHEIEILDLETGELIKKFGGPGGLDGLFNKPTHLAIDEANNIYVTDAFNFRMQEFDADGNFIKVIGRMGTYPGTFARPKGLDVDRDGNIFAADAAFEIIQIFDPINGEPLMPFGKYGPEPGGTYLPACVHIDYDNIDYFSSYVDKEFKVNYLIYVCNSLGDKKINVYGFGEWIGEPLIYDEPFRPPVPATSEAGDPSDGAISGLQEGAISGLQDQAGEADPAADAPR